MNKSAPSRSWPAQLTQAALGIAIALVIVRATSTQTLRDPLEISPGMLPAPRGMGAGGAVVLDLLLCVPALLVLLRAAVDRQFKLRFTYAHGAMFALAGWIAASAFWSADKFAASIEATHWLAAMVLLWSVSQLVRSWLHVRLIGGVCLGLLLVLTAHGLVYRFVDVPDERASFLQNEQRIYKERGWTADSFIAQQFKKKVMAGEIIGFSASPNTYAMELVLLGLVVGGMAVQRIADRDEWGWAAAMVLSVAPAGLCLWLTQCRAAFATPIFGGMVFGVGAALSRDSTELVEVERRMHRGAYWGVNAAILMVVAGVVGFGIARGGLVHDSLTFRWRYWIGAMRMVRDHLWRGVGFANFGDYYLAVRLPIASEEIRDPHNFFVRILSETGLIGAGLLIAWLMRLAWEITLPVRSTIQEVRSDKRTSLMPLFALAVAAMVLNVIVSVDLTQSAAFSLLEILKRILWAGLLSVGLAIGCMESSQRQQFDDRPAPWIVLAMLASLAMFMLHNTIEFGWFESGPTGMFALITGSLMGISSAGRERRATWPVFAAAVASWSAAAAFWVEPICRGESLATSGDDRVMANHLDDAVEAYRDATAALPVTDAQLLLKTATAQLYARADPAEVVPTMEASLSADPMFIRSHLARAELELRLVKPDAAVVRREYDQAIALDPADVGMRTDYANTLQSLGDYHGAALELEAALSANAGLSPDEPKRLSRQQVDEISQRISQLRAQLPAMP